jgi:hypothetical protein
MRLAGLEGGLRRLASPGFPLQAFLEEGEFLTWRAEGGCHEGTVYMVGRT